MAHGTDRPRIRIRAKMPKTRTGCLTCKIRRVKCDERRPNCLRCQKFGCVCDGYAAPKKPKSKDICNKITLPKIPPDFQPLFYQPTTGILQDEQEGRYFRLFCDKTAPQLSGYFDKNLWCRLVLQTCHSDPSVRHAVVAIAALDQILETAKDQQRDKTSESDRHHQFALLQYSKAIRWMREATSAGKQDLRTTLITCIVIVCFEAFHGNHESAVAQVRTGLELIEYWFKNNSPSKKSALGIKSPLPDVVEDELIKAFGRLDIHAMSVFDTRALETHHYMRNYGLEGVSAMPVMFTTVEEARIYLELVMQRLLHFMASILGEATNKGCIQIDAMVNCSSAVIAQRDKHLGELLRWHNAFLPFYTANTISPSQEHYIGATALQLHYLASWFGAGCKMTAAPSLDRLAFMSIFEQQVECARRILGHPQIATQNSHYTFDLQVIVPLYFVAWQCPYTPLRRIAVRLLLSRPRREGLWDAVLTGRIGRWIIDVETESADGGNGEVLEWIPDDMHITGLDIMFDMHAHTAKMKCEKPFRTEDGVGVIYERRSTVISW